MTGKRAMLWIRWGLRFSLPFGGTLKDAIRFVVALALLCILASPFAYWAARWVKAEQARETQQSSHSVDSNSR